MFVWITFSIHLTCPYFGARRQTEQTQLATVKLNQKKKARNAAWKLETPPGCFQITNAARLG